ncbi:MAG TPA: RHS repeat-associated core domain-containing protein [Rhodanobacter sp.]
MRTRNQHRPLLYLIVGLMLLLAGSFVHAGTVHYYYTDPQGTPLAKTDASGTIIASYDYTPYGTAVTSMSGAPDGPGYTGHVNDPDTGLVYMQARYYDPAVGRFLSVDPAGSGANKSLDFSPYAYAADNPIKNIDPDGKAPELPMLSQLKFARNYIQNEYEKAVVTVGHVFLNQSQRVSLAINAVGVIGTGIVGSKGIYNSPTTLGIIIAGGVGGELSMDAKYRVFTFNFTSTS